MDNLPLDVKREITSFNMFAPNLPVSVAGEMMKFIEDKTYKDGDGNDWGGVIMRLSKCVVWLQAVRDYYDDDLYEKKKLCYF